MNILQTSCVKPSINGGIPNVEYFLIKGLKEKGYNVSEHFPFLKSMVLSDGRYGMSLPVREELFDVIHTHTNIGWHTKGAFRTFHGCTAQGTDIAREEKGHVLKGGLYLKLNAFMEKRCARKNHCIAVSDYTANAISKYYGVPRDKVLTVHNGIDTDKFFPCKTCGWEMREEHGIPDNMFVVTWTGHMEYNKGIHYLLEIIDKCKKYENIIFVIRSSVQTKDIPKQYKWLLTSPNIKFLPHGEDMPEFYNMGNIHLMTSTYDPMPLTVLEAMSCGKAVIAPKSGGHSEVIQHNISGFLVDDHKNTYELANWIITMAEAPNWCARIGKAARKRILEKFTLEHMVNNYLAAYSWFKYGQHEAVPLPKTYRSVK